ncbi:hypothetical protein JKP88DRAFT_276134 [Tribonema minus]|uniref:Uncharacterized protein n=1 Tax=Tribonema minus TaxID=303371 RepID=A0A835Z7E3_9STRA|nr:hypothetical protein JKP88DRAFT_276134 [Tribonema minus]
MRDEQVGTDWENPTYTAFGKEVSALRDKELAAAGLSVSGDVADGGNDKDGGDALVAYFLYHPYKGADFFTGKRRRDGGEGEFLTSMASRSPAAMCGFTQLMKLGYTLDFPPQHPYQDQSLCVRDGNVSLVGVYLRCLGALDTTNELQRVWYHHYFTFFQHLFYWRSGEAAPADVKSVVKAAWDMHDKEAFCGSVFATFRPRLAELTEMLKPCAVDSVVPAEIESAAKRAKV